MTDSATLKDQWLSEIFGYDVLRIDSKIFTDQTLQQLSEQRSGRALYYCKVPTVETDKVERLEKAGFNVIDTNVTFEKEINNTENAQSEIRFAEHKDIEKVAEIARSTFKFSRFHLDQNVPLDVASQIKSEWVRNYFSGKRGDAMVVAMDRGEVAGFLQLLFLKQKVLLIDLIGVSEGSQGKGLGARMIEFAEQSCRSLEGRFEKIRVGTQVSNIPSIRLYEKLGFRLIESSYVMHLHVGRSPSKK